MRNLLGRLHARTSDTLFRIAQRWYVPLYGRDSGRHVGSLYRVMTDIRAVRSTWTRLSDLERRIVHLLAAPDARPMTVNDLMTALDASEDEVRPACVSLFHWGILAREGDAQELPVGQSPKLFVPRELTSDFRQVQEEISGGDQSSSPLRQLLQLRDDPDLEESAAAWGIRVIPGLRRRDELIEDILRAVSERKKIDDAVAALRGPARALWDTVRSLAEHGPVLLDDAVDRAGLTVPEATDAAAIARGAQLRETLAELEVSLLVQHTWRPDGERALFVPQEILFPGAVATTLPLRPLQPIAIEDVQPDEQVHPFALAWDMLTVVREIASRGTPVWTPGEPLSRSWQRQLNSRLWFGREDVPPEGYLALLLHLGMAVGVLEALPRPAGSSDKDSLRFGQTSFVRQWRGMSFADQTRVLRDGWITAEAWIEARERDRIYVYGPDWQGFRRRLLGALRNVDPAQWFSVRDAARRFAEQDTGMVGNTFTFAQSQSRDATGADSRIAALAEIIELEIETAMAWFGFVELGRITGKGRAMRVKESAHAAAGDLRATPDESEPQSGRALSMDDAGLITLHRPAPLHLWSLSAFADAETLRPDATYQLRPGSVGRALSAGFDRTQIENYLHKQSGEGLPDAVQTNLTEWTAGFKRVRMRRLVRLTPDVEDEVSHLRELLEKNGIDVVMSDEQSVVLEVPGTDERGRSGEDRFTALLRRSGYVGQWED